MQPLLTAEVSGTVSFHAAMFLKKRCVNKPAEPFITGFCDIVPTPSGESLRINIDVLDRKAFSPALFDSLIEHIKPFAVGHQAHADHQNLKGE